jgi:hypothetical protein
VDVIGVVMGIKNVVNIGDTMDQTLLSQVGGCVDEQVVSVFMDQDG